MIMYMIYQYALMNVRLNVSINIIILVNDLLLGCYLCTCIKHIKLSQHVEITEVL